MRPYVFVKSKCPSGAWFSRTRKTHVYGWRSALSGAAKAAAGLAARRHSFVFRVGAPRRRGKPVPAGRAGPWLICTNPSAPPSAGCVAPARLMDDGATRGCLWPSLLPRSARGVGPPFIARLIRDSYGHCAKYYSGITFCSQMLVSSPTRFRRQPRKHAQFGSLFGRFFLRCVSAALILFYPITKYEVASCT